MEQIDSSRLDNSRTGVACVACESDKKTLDFTDVFHVLKKYKITFFTVMIAFTVPAIAIAFLSTPVYRAEVLLAPVSNEDNNRVNSLVSQFGGIAAMTGFNINGKKNSVDETIALLESRKFTNLFIKEENILPILFSKLWNDETGRWKTGVRIPTEWNAYKLFNNLKLVSIDKHSSLVTISVDWHDPVLAAKWANKLVERINNKLRIEAIAEADKSISYLESELQRTDIIEVKQSIYGLIEAQTKNKMLANTRNEFAFRILDPATVPEEIVRPRKKLIILLGLILGLVFGTVGAFLRFYSAGKSSNK